MLFPWPPLRRTQALLSVVLACAVSCGKKEGEPEGAGAGEAGRHSQNVSAVSVAAFDPEEQFAEIATLDPKLRGVRLASFYRTWGQREGERAVLHAEREGMTKASASLREAFAGWVASEGEAAEKWLVGLDGGRRRASLALELAAALSDVAARAALADQLAHSAAGRKLRSRVIVEYAQRDPRAGLLWLEKGEPGAASRDVGALVRTWAEEDPHAASESVVAMAPGPVRDAAVISLVAVIAVEQPDAARQWAETIADAGQRERIGSMIDAMSADPFSNPAGLAGGTPSEP